MPSYKIDWANVREMTPEKKYEYLSSIISMLQRIEISNPVEIVIQGTIYAIDKKDKEIFIKCFEEKQRAKLETQKSKNSNKVSIKSYFSALVGKRLVRKSLAATISIGLISNLAVMPSVEDEILHENRNKIDEYSITADFHVAKNFISFSYEM